jgi:hypothetical protein
MLTYGFQEAPMYQADTEMLFPARVTPSLKNLRGASWKALVEQVTQQPDGSAESLAFGLMMIRLNDCLSCHADSYRALRGCTACAQQTVTRCKETDQGLLTLYRTAEKDVAQYLREGGVLDA